VSQYAGFEAIFCVSPEPPGALRAASRSPNICGSVNALTDDLRVVTARPEPGKECRSRRAAVTGWPDVTDDSPTALAGCGRGSLP